MTVGDFLAWPAVLSDDGRYELVGGRPVRLMSPTNLRYCHVRGSSARVEPHILREGDITLGPPGIAPRARGSLPRPSDRRA